MSNPATPCYRFVRVLDVSVGDHAYPAVLYRHSHTHLFYVLPLTLAHAGPPAPTCPGKPLLRAYRASETYFRRIHCFLQRLPRRPT